MLAHADKVFWPEAVKHLMTTGLRATTAKWKYDTTAKRKYDTTTKRKFDRTAKKEIWIERLHIWKIPLCQNCKAIKYQDSVKIFHHSTQPTQWINKQMEQLSYDTEPTQDVFPIVLHLFFINLWKIFLSSRRSRLWDLGGWLVGRTITLISAPFPLLLYH